MDVGVCYNYWYARKLQKCSPKSLVHKTGTLYSLATNNGSSVAKTYFSNGPRGKGPNERTGSYITLSLVTARNVEADESGRQTFSKNA